MLKVKKYIKFMFQSYKLLDTFKLINFESSLTNNTII